MKLNKSQDQQELLTHIQKELKRIIEQKVDNTTARFIDGSITVEPLQPNGWKITFKTSLQVSPLDVKIETPE